MCISEFETRLFYKSSFRAVRCINRNPFLTKNKQRKTLYSLGKQTESYDGNRRNREGRVKGRRYRNRLLESKVIFMVIRKSNVVEIH